MMKKQEFYIDAKNLIIRDYGEIDVHLALLVAFKLFIVTTGI